MEFTPALMLGLFVSLCGNAYQFFRFKKKPPKETYDARDLLRELLTSSAVVEIKVMDKSTFFLRSPRG